MSATTTRPRRLPLLVLVALLAAPSLLATRGRAQTLRTGGSREGSDDGRLSVGSDDGRSRDGNTNSRYAYNEDLLNDKDLLTAALVDGEEIDHLMTGDDLSVDADPQRQGSRPQDRSTQQAARVSEAFSGSLIRGSRGPSRNAHHISGGFDTALHLLPLPQFGGFHVRNEFLATSAWPCPHRSGFAAGSSPYCAPTGEVPLKHDFLSDIHHLSDPIVLAYSNDNKYAWGVSWTSVFKIDRSTPQLRLVDFKKKSWEEIREDKFHGAYSLLDYNGVFFTAIGNRIEAFHDDPRAVPHGSRIVKSPNAFVFQREYPGEVIRAMCMTSAGELAFSTDYGRVGVVGTDIRSAKFQTPRAVVKLGSTKSVNDKDHLEVSNNIACDERGGIYVVSDKSVH
eukprot:GHVU01056316.1.p1 GENE.GHVU01056316.1~~GHVU01056316.1.p1  ORF type:complete len:394 (-),score=46.93 GHVU01056316.1:2003-3184(-)